LALLSVAVVTLVAVCSLLLLVVRNGQRAEDWQRRSEQQEVSIGELQRVLGVRSAELNQRTRQVNKLTVAVKRSQTALRRSESDVSSLASRQRALANEKAQVEDDRAQLRVEASALSDIAVLFQDCSDGLVDVLTAVLNDDYAYATEIVGGVGSSCRSARSGLSAYQSG
jgi:septal ring factor EnvC (AmiA/AmiB activator)